MVHHKTDEWQSSRKMLLRQTKMYETFIDQQARRHFSIYVSYDRAVFEWALLNPDGEQEYSLPQIYFQTSRGDQM